MTPFSVDAHIRNRYMRGKCAQFAMPAATGMNLELWAMRNKGGGPEHVFAYDPARDIAVDVRGVMRLNEVAKGSSLEESGDEIVFSKIAKAEIRQIFGGEGMIEAVRAVNQLLPLMKAAVLDEMESRRAFNFAEVTEDEPQDDQDCGPAF